MLFYQKIPTALFNKLFKSLIWKVDTNNNEVFLTFDDGPHPEITMWVLELLEKYNFKATFFCVGDNVKKFNDTYNKIIEKGHSVGNHTQHHIKGWKTQNSYYLEDVNKCEKWVDSNLFRPPYGQIKKSQILLLKSKYKIIMWSLLACDFQKKLNIQKALYNLKKHTKNGSIIVFHDSLKCEQNLKSMLPYYLEFLKEKGFNSSKL